MSFLSFLPLLPCLLTGLMEQLYFALLWGLLLKVLLNTIWFCHCLRAEVYHCILHLLVPSCNQQTNTGPSLVTVQLKHVGKSVLSPVFSRQ